MLLEQALTTAISPLGAAPPHRPSRWPSGHGDADVGGRYGRYSAAITTLMMPQPAPCWWCWYCWCCSLCHVHQPHSLANRSLVRRLRTQLIGRLRLLTAVCLYYITSITYSLQQLVQPTPVNKGRFAPDIYRGGLPHPLSAHIVGTICRLLCLPPLRAPVGGPLPPILVGWDWWWPTR